MEMIPGLVIALLLAGSLIGVIRVARIAGVPKQLIGSAVAMLAFLAGALGRYSG
jgi:hypothetical protein